MKTVAILALCTAVPAFASVSEARAVAGFDGLDFSNAVEATVSQGDAVSVRVEASDADTLKHVVTEVKDGTLKVRLDGKLCWNCEVKAFVVLPRLARLHVSGASKAQVDGTFGPRLELEASGAAKTVVRGLKAAALTARASGASNVELAGQVTAVEADISGASKLDAPKLTAQNVKADVSGASSLALRAEAGIEADLSGASSLNVWGKPTSRKVQTSGASAVHWKD